MVELFETYKWKPARVIAGKKKECTKSLSQYPNFLGEQEVGFGIRKYFYKATDKEMKDFKELRDEEHAD